jgi:hypothetical protein
MEKKRIVLIIGLTLLLISVLYVPWDAVSTSTRFTRGQSFPLRYGCVFDSPSADYPFKVVPNYGRIALTAIGVCIATGIAYLIVGKKNGK